MTDTPLVSVIIDNYNYGRFLGAAIDSALNQTYPHIEVIVVDDGSTDDSRDVISLYGEQILPIFKDDGGQGSALNTGFKASGGEFIQFLDSDDYYWQHESSGSSRSFEERVQFEIEVWPPVFRRMLELYGEMGIDIDETQVERWLRYSWFLPIHRATKELLTLVPEEERFVLIGTYDLGDNPAILNRAPRPLFERQGVDWGLPVDDSVAISEVERAQREGIRYIVFAWPSFWLFDHYRVYTSYLHSQFKCLLSNERLVIFDMHPPRDHWQSAAEIPLISIDT